MNKYILFGAILTVLLFSGCGDGDINTSTEVQVANSADGTVRQNTNIVNDEHLHSHYYGEANTDEDGKHVLLLHKGFHELQEGQSIVFGRTDQFPNGLMRKVESIHEHDDKTKVVTSQAALDDVFEDLNITHSVKLKPAPIIGKDEKNIDGGDVIRVLHEEDGVSLSQNSDPMESGDNPLGKSKRHDLNMEFTEVDLGHGVTINGSIDMSLSCHLKISLNTICKEKKWGVCYSWKTVLGHTYFYIQPEQDGEVRLSATDSLTFEKEKTLAEYTFPSIDIPVGIVPVVIVPKLRFIADVNGDVTAGMSVGLTQDSTSKAGITYKKKPHHSRHHWYLIKDIENEIKMIPPQFNANSFVKVSTGPLLELLIYDITGPKANLDIFLEADADLEDDPWWTLQYGVEANAGFILDVLGHEFAEVSYNIYDYQEDLAHATGAFGE